MHPHSFLKYRYWSRLGFNVEPFLKSSHGRLKSLKTLCVSLKSLGNGGTGINKVPGVKLYSGPWECVLVLLTQFTVFCVVRKPSSWSIQSSVLGLGSEMSFLEKVPLIYEPTHICQRVHGAFDSSLWASGGTLGGESARDSSVVWTLPPPLSLPLLPSGPCLLLRSCCMRSLPPATA